MPNTGKITQIIGAVLDIKFTEGHLPSIYEAIHITRKNGELLVVEVAQHLGDETSSMHRNGSDRRTGTRHGGRGDRCADLGSGRRGDAGPHFQCDR